MIRSNSPGETLSSRGSLASYPAAPTREAAADAIDKLFAASEGEVMCALLQVGIEPGIAGHMSNERRVSQRKDFWLVEEFTHDSQVHQYTVQGKRSDARDSLRASTESDLKDALRRAAGFLVDIENGRFHCEWVWSGKQVWLVQADEAEAFPCNATVDSYLNGVDTIATGFTPRSCLRHFRDVDSGKWKKLRRPKLFQEIGIPCADVFLLSGEQWTNRNLFERAELERDFNKMCCFPVVVRYDVADDVEIDETLLPTSAPLTDTRELANFLDHVAHQFERERLSPTDWAFLFAFFVPARASAMVLARPHAQRIQVDALWGLPDGLLHFPHDRWFYYPETGKTSEQRRYKSHCVLPGESEWATHELGSPFDWSGVLSDEEVAAAANWALRVANELGHEIQLMILARIGGQRGATACLPWHYTKWSVPKYEKSLRAIPYSPAVAVVTSPDDLDGLQHRPIGSRKCGLLIRPNAEWRRNMDFLERAAKIAAEQDAPIYFEGSLLGHAYYIMQRAGAMVVPVLHKEPKDEARVFNKLVRDRIPVIIREAGGLARVRRLGGAYAIALLKQKLIEEVFEVWSAAEQDIAEELVDVLDVVEALRDQMGISKDELEKIGEDKRLKRGGFDEMLFLEQTTIASLREERRPQKQFPQFGKEEAVPAIRGTPTRHFRVVDNEEPRVLLTLEALLTPPVNASKECEVVELASEVLEVNAEHVGNKLVVQISRPAPAISPNQLLLFPEMEDGETERE